MLGPLIWRPTAAQPDWRPHQGAVRDAPPDGLEKLLNSKRTAVDTHTPCQLVLLPGVDGTGRLFEPFVQALASQVVTTVVQYSSPELSRYSDCRAAAERILPRDQPYLIVGESFSGPIAVAIAASRPPGLRGIVLAGSFVTCPSRLLSVVPALTRVMPTHRPGRGMEFLLLGRYATPERRLLLKQAMALVSPRAIRARVDAIARVNVIEELRRVEVPILYLRATHDRLVPRACGDEIAGLRRCVRMEEVCAPHMLLQCAPLRCAGLVDEFAQECGEL